MATRNQQLPYLKSRQSLDEKLLGLSSENQQDDLFLLNQILLFEGTNPSNPDLLDLSDLPHPMLEQLIQILLNSCTFWLTGLYRSSCPNTALYRSSCLEQLTRTSN